LWGTLFFAAEGTFGPPKTSILLLPLCDQRCSRYDNQQT
jgi:hypothetical protein